MLNMLYTIYLCIILFVKLNEIEGLERDFTTCSIKLNNTVYHIMLSENLHSLDSRDFIQEWDINGKTKNTNFPEGHHSRVRRSTDPDKSTSHIEIRRLKRKIGRLEKTLSESITHGFRRIEEKIRDIEMPKQSKRAVRYLQSNTVCPKDFYTVDVDKLQSCYLLSNFNATWYEAKMYCTALGSELVALGSIREHYVLTYLIKNHPDYSKANGWWTSGTFVAKTKQWMWTSETYKPFTFIRWAQNQPDDDTANCVYLRRDHDHLWNDEICIMKFNFVCEKCFNCDRDG